MGGIWMVFTGVYFLSTRHPRDRDGVDPGRLLRNEHAGWQTPVIHSSPSILEGLKDPIGLEFDLVDWMFFLLGAAKHMANKAGINNTKGFKGTILHPTPPRTLPSTTCKPDGNPHTLSPVIVICSQRNQCEHLTGRGLHVVAGPCGRSINFPPHFPGPRSLRPKRTILRGQYQAARRPIKELNNLFLHVCLARLQRDERQRM
jgi:hypothetical protein